uniref:Uncharacterized protein n=1 Tax=Cucumis melo TaxID=3656 RepID=A0A9I9CU94_CUCME
MIQGSVHCLHTWMSVHQLLTCMDTDVAIGNITNICIMNSCRDMRSTRVPTRTREQREARTT